MAYNRYTAKEMNPAGLSPLVLKEIYFKKEFNFHVGGVELTKDNYYLEDWKTPWNIDEKSKQIWDKYYWGLFNY